MEIIHIDELDIAYPAKNNCKTERLTTPKKITRGCEQSLYDGRHSSRCTKRRTTNPSTTIDVVKDLTEEEIKTPDRIPDISVVNLKRMALFGLHDLLNGILPTSYIVWSKSVDSMSCS